MKTNSDIKEEPLELEPNPSRLIEGLRDTGYDFNTAAADIIDNSIAANAKNINIELVLHSDGRKIVYFGDDGDGMDSKGLENAMKEQSTEIPSKIRVTSFFCGCGGLDLGFIGGFKFKGQKVPPLPFTIEAAYDHDPKCIETYTKNISDHAQVADLANYDPAETPKSEVLIGGFPCQDFATCGPRNGLTSSRGQLYQALIKYMEKYRPKIVVGENVPGLANINKGEALKTIVGDLKKTGYKVEVWILYAPNYGIPQRRTRLFIIGVRDDIDGFPEIPKPTFSDKKYRTTRWAIEDLEKITDESIANQSQFFKASKAKKGNGQGDETTPPDSPSYTIRANAKSRVQFHYSLARRLTIRECARLQTFPDSFKFPHSATTNIMQIGNAVPPVLGHKVASAVHCFLTKEI